MKHALTVKKLEALKPKDKRYRVADGDGLEVSVETSGKKIFRARIMVNGVRKEITYGHYPQMSLAQAREVHAREAAKIKSSAPRSETFSTLFQHWVSHYAMTASVRTKRPPTERTVRKQKDRFRLHLSELHDMRVDEITRGRVVEIFDDMDAREEARQTFNLLHMFYEWAILREHAQHSPLEGIRARTLGLSPGRPGQRALSLDDMALLWGKLTSVRGIAVKVLLLTGARRSMVAGMRWDELDGEWWRIPDERMKNREKHLIYNNFAEEIEPLRLLGSDYVFPLRKDGKHLKDKHMRADSITTYISRLCADEDFELPDFCVHDLRRSVRTAWAEDLKTLPHIAEMMLAHKLEKLEGVYNKAKLLDEQKAVWIAWRDLLLSRVSKLSKPVNGSDDIDSAPFVTP